jgi:hypothetical protein
VKLSSEAADYVSITPVVARDMPVRELVEYMLGLTGKDEARIRELLLRGTLVSGASRLRWAGWQADDESIRSLLATFPDPDPGRRFAAEYCVRAILRGSRHPIAIPREIGSRRAVMASLLRRPSFWDALMAVGTAGAPQYREYSYRDRADVYHQPLGVPGTQKIREAAHLLRYTALEAQIRNTPIDSAEFYLQR